MHAHVSALKPDTHVGEYVIDRVLHVRDPVVVYRASQPALGRAVALNVLEAPIGGAEAEAFVTRARTAARASGCDVRVGTRA